MSITSIDDRKITVGLDVGDRWVHACFLDADGEIVEEARLAATAQGTSSSGRYLPALREK